MPELEQHLTLEYVGVGGPRPLVEISAPTLILSGLADLICGPEFSRELNDAVPEPSAGARTSRLWNHGSKESPRVPGRPHRPSKEV
jgi:hypothetical protein